ncbi:hypothetical protein NQ038_04735 [Brevibacterium sp. 50QC2O2]|uniref:hypothetical protein n=1 Tax=Brevibacterium TaxID=1696 RepID=UPI00211C2651|nr:MULTISPECIES: hypothetical protein [unclassified Brevibacterium]MCQ9367693.1 hypothetical protein [Brevibacterium sp. 91QC2O2]MCQ9385001.1 hypothetical protein [Brevibacterium sp. 68QC2CO]MCQ9387952.1 hypothetical protein [Brevibacterium sp. 50QC2O2]
MSGTLLEHSTPARLVVLPTAPAYVPGVNPGATTRQRAFSARVVDLLAGPTPLTFPARRLPALAGLGGYGLDRGVDLRTGTHICVGAAWRAACARLKEEERRACLAAHSGLGVVAELVAASGPAGRLRAWPALEPERGQAVGSTDPVGAAGPELVIVPVDLSARSTPDGPLAPLPGAAEFDRAVLAALRAWDVPGLEDLHRDQARFAADLDAVVALHSLTAAHGLRWEPGPAELLVEELDGVTVVSGTLTGSWTAARA